MAKIDENGNWRTPKGTVIHPDRIPVTDKLEDMLADGLADEAEKLNIALREFKIKAYARCYGLFDLLREKYNMERIAGKTGAVTLSNYDRTVKVKIAVNKLIEFDQKINLAQEKISKWMTFKSTDIDQELKTVIMDKFSEKDGKVKVREILDLKKYDFEGELWEEAMELIDESLKIAGTKSYITFKKKKGGQIDGAWEDMVLNLSKLPVSELEIDKKIELNNYREEIKEILKKSSLSNIPGIDWQKHLDNGLSPMDAVNVEFTKLSEQGE